MQHTIIPTTMTYCLAALLSLAVTAVACDCGPTPIFLLDGQSNMVGMGSLEHLGILLHATKTHAEYKHLWNATSNDWAERSDVYIKFGDQVGKLKAGLGAGGPQNGGHIGPELEFGWTLGENSCGCNKPTLLLKAAYGGRNLAIDFRPPLSGVGNYSGVKPMYYGWEYREMITSIQNTLENELPSILPNYNETEGYVLAGLVWFQGWNDMLNWPMVNEYEYNLVNLIRSMRLDLDAPDLPIIIGELGMHGMFPTGRGADRVAVMRHAERRVAARWFRGSSKFVETAKYVVANESTYNGNYHYYGRADTYCHIGKDFGRAMLELLEKKSSGDLELDDGAHQQTVTTARHLR